MSGNHTDPRVCFVVPVLNGDKYIRKCLEHIRLEKHPDDEVVVVDNGSTDNTVNIVGQFDNVKILEFPTVTISALRNRGASASSSPLIAFIDADCLVCKNWRRNVISAMSDPDVAATGSFYDLPESPTWIEKAWYSQRSNEIRTVMYLTTGNLIVRRNVFEQLTGFDENLITDEDCDFGERLNQAGMCLLSVPKIRVIHLGNPKTLYQFYGKQMWRATSFLKTQSWRKIDRPTFMTIVFLFSLLITALSFPFAASINGHLIWAMLAVSTVPLVTALFRIVQYRSPRYFVELYILYNIFYVARALTILKSLFRKGPI